MRADVVLNEPPKDPVDLQVWYRLEIEYDRAVAS
jgi:hypothetical protein